jgi:hypothetical protein
MYGTHNKKIKLTGKAICGFELAVLCNSLLKFLRTVHHMIQQLIFTVRCTYDNLDLGRN